VTGLDAVVVGGGLLGCATAYNLARGGAEVALLERGELNREASGQNAGSLHFQLEYRMVEPGDEVAEQFALTIPLCLDAAASWASLHEELGEEIGAHLEGGLMVAETETQLEALRRKSALENRYGLRTHVVDGDEARAIAPYLSSAVLGACWCAEEGHANPRLAAPAFAAAAARLGAKVRTRTPVVGIARDGSGWRVATHAGEGLSAGAVVLAAGLWSTELAALVDVPLPLDLHALTILATARVPPLVGHLVQHVGERLSLKQTAEGNVLVGGGWRSRLHLVDGEIDTGRRPALVYGAIAGNAAIAARIVPAVSALQAIRIWTGVVGVTFDNVPILGEVPERPGLYVATGGNAFTLGPTLARLAAELVLEGGASFPLETFSPARLVA
jgi:glycine/D-amino acid oxidase-like deaminating enzyme